MTDVDNQRPRPVLPATRVLLVSFAVLTVLAVAALFVQAERTAQFFAWTIRPSLTAAFLGAGYGAGFVLVALALRARHWAYVRITMITVFFFTLITLLATVLHLDRLHFAAAGPLARAAAWFWLGVYIVLPLAMVVALVQQWRTNGTRPGPPLPMPAALSVVLGVQGALMVAVGVALFVRPDTARTLWPWMLTPLTARVVAAWLLAFGVAALLALRARDLGPLRSPAIGYAVFGLLQLVALARFPEQVRWQHPSAWIYLGMLATIVFAGGWGIWAARRGAQRAGPSGAADLRRSGAGTGP